MAISDVKMLLREPTDPLPGIGASSPALTLVLGKGDDGYSSIVCVAQALSALVIPT